ncbi:heme acquisition protein HasA [Yersinia enterocolitica]|uniref:heme acquisition protein HasA n=3 Tax=Yersinia enterocolitica TaxID=630 RepID=UPI0005DCF964|nr:heme acquisition protein HasA [Yersinia enterocolitica]ELI8171610.1 hemophore [Yersinia enterocolitica]ELW7390113.1 hemophore [Yersinia enterocolitica]ELZ1907346.1 hemophore [Yersinia enterocolitica]EMA7649748.1 hemophore [Yersinia enterocolitica]CFB71342.1 hemophore [Yersinia enterocolitica]
MTVTIGFNANIKDETIYSYTHKWIADFNIPTEEGSNFGGFHGLKDSITRQFEQFSVTNTSGNKATIIMSGEINFNLCHRAIYGKVESLELGKEGLIQNVNSHIIIEKHLVEPQLIFNDLNIIGEYDDFKITAENRKNDIHQIGFNLKKDNADILLEILKSQGVDVNLPLKDMVSASQFNIPVIDALGTNDSNEILLAA